MLSSFPSIICVIVDTFLLLRFTKQLSQPLHSRPDTALEVGRNDRVIWSPHHTRGSVVTADQPQT